jgi:cytidylate kinase
MTGGDPSPPVGDDAQPVRPVGSARTERRGNGMTNGTPPTTSAAPGNGLHHADGTKSPRAHRGDVRPTTGEDHRRVIAIDGPVASGKTTVARALAARLGATYLDTGLLYRAVTLAALRAGLSPADGAAIARMTRESQLQIIPSSAPGESEQVLVNGEVVTPLLRTVEVNRQVSEVSAHPEVRSALLPIQQRMAANGTVVMAGRDITTVVVPDAGVKVFLRASLDERARRRLQENEALGRQESLESVRRDIERRDLADSSRSVAPLRTGDDVTIVNTDGKSIESVVEEIVTLARRTWNEQTATERPALDA